MNQPSVFSSFKLKNDTLKKIDNRDNTPLPAYSSIEANIADTEEALP